MPFGLICLFSLAIEPEKSYQRPELLIEAAELKKAHQQFRLLDVRTRAAYSAGHIPGAAWVSHFEWGREFSNTADVQRWAERIGKLGIDADTAVVVYGDGISPDAALVWWIAHYWGLRDVRLLNGGWGAWKAVGGEAAQDEAVPQPKRFALNPQDGRLAVKSQLLDWLKTGNKQIVDARSIKEHRGDTVTAERNGTIPGAKHLEWSDLVDKSSQKFKGPEILSRLFQERGIDPNKPCVTFCQSGRRSAVMAFALELMGDKDVRNYVMSWSEWGNDPATPIEKPTVKQ